eukprot:3267800-Amphidinium_carterae.2
MKQPIRPFKENLAIPFLHIDLQGLQYTFSMDSLHNASCPQLHIRKLEKLGPPETHPKKGNDQKYR